MDKVIKKKIKDQEELLKQASLVEESQAAREKLKELNQTFKNKILDSISVDVNKLFESLGFGEDSKLITQEIIKIVETKL